MKRDQYLNDPFGRAGRPPPAEYMMRDPGRAQRVRWCAEVFKALLDCRLPSLEARLFVGGAGMAWLEGGGSLDKDHLRVRAPFGSHHGPAYLWRLLRDQDATFQGETCADADGTIDPNSRKALE